MIRVPLQIGKVYQFGRKLCLLLRFDEMDHRMVWVKFLRDGGATARVFADGLKYPGKSRRLQTPGEMDERA